MTGDGENSIETNQLLKNLIIDHRELSICIRLVVIDYFLGKNNFGDKLYTRSMRLRYSTHLFNTDKFYKLFQDIKTNGISDPLVLANQNIIIDGHHRFACAIHNNFEQIPYTKCEHYQYHLRYSWDWFEANFGPLINAAIKNKQYLLYDKVGYQYEKY